MAEKRVSGFSPAGETTTAHDNGFFSVHQTPMHFVNPNTGEFKYGGDGKPVLGTMNHMEMKPGVMVVADMGREGTILVPQERWATNLTVGRSVMHWEVPGGGLEGDETLDQILESAEREAREEAGFTAADFQLIGNRAHGVFPHTSSTDHNYTVLARDARWLEQGSDAEDAEVIGEARQFTWHETESMYLSDEGLQTPEGFQVISSAIAISSLATASAYLRHEEM